MNKLLNIVFAILMVVIVLFAAWPILNGNIYFHTDISRDFMLMEDIWNNRNITLIGPRSGGIPGVFHGPLWLYFNLPAFIIGGGNPVVVGWFWVVAFVVSVAIILEVTRRMYDLKAGLVAALMYASAAGGTVHSSFNPTGAMLFFPSFFYLFWLYFQKKNPYVLAASMFILGCLVQFQMAFGGPIMVLALPLVLFHIVKTRNYIHLIALSAVLIPLSTFALFEYRHEFLQTKSVLSYLNGAENTGQVDKNMRDLIYSRLELMFKDAMGLVSYNTTWLSIATGWAIMSATFSTKKKIRWSAPILLFLYLFVGYWIVTLPYKGTLWDYYFVPFTGGIAIMFAASYKSIHKYAFLLLFVILLANNIQVLYWKTVDANINQGYWSFYKGVAEKVFEKAPSEFGYYVYTTDQFGYSTRYAMKYFNQHRDDTNAVSDQKRETTFLLIDDPGNNAASNSRDWKLYDVRIAETPTEVEQISESYRIERYVLSTESQQIESNPYMLNSIIFR